MAASSGKRPCNGTMSVRPSVCLFRRSTASEQQPRAAGARAADSDVQPGRGRQIAIDAPHPAVFSQFARINSPQISSFQSNPAFCNPYLQAIRRELQAYWLGPGKWPQLLGQCFKHACSSRPYCRDYTLYVGYACRANELRRNG